MSKWNFLEPWVISKWLDNDISCAELAREAQEVFNRPESVEVIRKEINKIKKSLEVAKTITGSMKVNPVFTNNVITNTTFTTFSDGHIVANPIREPINQITEPGDYLVLGCLHVPGHNPSMLEGIYQMIADNKKSIKGLMLIGDFVDMNSLSGHDVNKFTALPGLTLSAEYVAGNHVLDRLTENLQKGAAKVYLYGNHEDRWNRYMSDMQRAKTPLPSPREALRLDSRGFSVFEKWDQDFITLGKHLDLMHGQYFNVHSAKKHIDTYRGSVMYAHTHRIQTYIEGSTGGFNIGWGGSVHSPLFEYMPRGTKKQWMNGFAVVTIDQAGEYYVNQVYHHNNKFYYNGKCYKN